MNGCSSVSRSEGTRGKDGVCASGVHDRIMRITRVIGHDKLSLSAYIDHVLTHHFNQCEEAIRAFTPGITTQYFNPQKENVHE